jgi:hypothetical protein
VLANVGCDVDAVVDAELELVPAAPELALAAAEALLELVLDPPLDPPQPATSAATASSVTKTFIRITSRAPAASTTQAPP